MNKNNYGESNRSNQSKKSKNVLLGIIIGLFVIAVIALAGVYAAGERYYSTHFLKGTVVNDIDVSGMTIEELNQKIRLYQLTITERTAEGDYVDEIITGDEIGLQLSSTEDLRKILENQKKGKWITENGQSYDIDNFVDYDSEVWEQCMGYLQCFSDEFQQAPTDATLSEYDEVTNTYQIIPETQGNQLKKQQAVTLLSEAVRQLVTSVNLEEEDCYVTPTVYSDDSQLNTLLTNLNHFVNVTITYTFGDTIEVVDGDLINQWVVINEDNSISLDTAHVDEYVASLRKKYDTIFRSRTFVTTYGEEITIPTGDYGWWMNYGQESKELAAMIEAGESGERTPVYYQTAAQYGKQDYGNTYIELNLTAQHMFYYENGELVLESDFVSGNSSKGNATPDGVYGVTYKQRNATLVGEDYETPVSYWMPFNMHIGLHDATWRYQFGSDLYKKSGSHGCINLPYKVAQELYSRISQGTAVICYYLEGTESDSITEQTSEDIAQAVIERISEIGAVTKDSEKAIVRARTVYEELTAAEKKLVTNYDVLTAAEKAYKELTKKK